jgi:hypothetical protein
VGFVDKFADCRVSPGGQFAAMPPSITNSLPVTELTGSPGCSSCQRCGAGRSAVHLATHAAAFPWFLPCQPWARSAACSGQWTNDERR